MRSPPTVLSTRSLLLQRLDGSLEFGHSAGQFVDQLPFWIGKVSMFQCIGRVHAAHHASGNPDNSRLVRHRPHDNRARTDLGIVADPDVAQDLRAGADHHAVADRRMPLARLLAGAAKGHALVEKYIVADL